MKRSYTLSALLAVLAVAAGLYSYRQFVPEHAAAAASAAIPRTTAKVIAAAGRVEPVSEELKIASEIAGRLREVRVDEGDRVRRGQILAVVDNDDYRARLALAEAQFKSREADLARIVNGTRTQERREAFASVNEAKAVMENARAEMERRQKLHLSGDISRSDAERAEREYLVAKARYEASEQRHSFVDAEARYEDRDRAQAEIAAARAQVDLARANLEKTIIRSPIDGVVLRRYLRTGENIADTPDTPVVSLGNDQVLRVRVDIDESDVAKIRIGQRAYVTADAYGNKKFTGKVVRIGQILGRKNVRTDEPSERVDTKILETLVELDAGQRLPNGLRVDAFLEVGQ